ncbi:MAG: hypothetical protein HN904_06160, partial [Victivallales bacterium]|nr:hypothetical protein [Victivallales bacterium]
TGKAAPPWGLDTERTTGADWVLNNRGNSVALSVVTGKTMIEIEKAVNKKVKGRRPHNLAYFPALDQAKIDPAKRYKIAFSHNMLGGIYGTHGILDNVEAGGRYMPQDILAELMKTKE